MASGQLHQSELLARSKAALLPRVLATKLINTYRPGS